MFTFDFANFWNNFRFLCRLWSLRNQHSTVPITTTVKHPCTCTGGVMTQGHAAATCCSHKTMCCSHKGDMFVCMQCYSVTATCVPATRPCYMWKTHDFATAACPCHMFLLCKKLREVLLHFLETCYLKFFWDSFQRSNNSFARLVLANFQSLRFTLVSSWSKLLFIQSYIKHS